MARFARTCALLLLCACARRAPARGSASAPDARPEHNFRFRAPGPAWSAADTGRIDPGAAMAYTRAQPDLSFLVYVERPGDLVALDQVLASWRQQLEGRAGRPVAVSAAPLELHGLSGTRAEAIIPVAGAEVAYVDWIVQRNGFLYQLLAWGRAVDLQAVRDESTALFSGFELIDPAARAAPVRRPARPFASRELGYAIDLGLPWMQWRAAPDEIPAAEIGALCGEARVIVAPVPLLGHHPPLDAAVTGLLALLDLRAAPELPRVPLRIAGWSGYEMPYEREVKGRWMRYRVWAVVGEESALLAAEWRPPEQSESDCAEPLEKLVLGRAPRMKVEAVQRKPAAARFFAEVARSLRASGRAKASPEYLAQAGSLAPGEPAYLVEEVRGLQQLGRNNEAVLRIAERLHGAPCASALRIEAAQLLADLGHAPEALATWTSAFGCGYRDPAALGRYLRFLERDGRVSFALREAQAYADPADLPRLRGELVAGDR